MWRRLVAFCRHCVKRTETHWMPVRVHLQKASIRMTVIKAPLLLLFFLGDFLLSFVFGAKYIEKVRPVNKPHHPALFLFFLSISVFASFAFLRIHTPSPLNQEGAWVSVCYKAQGYLSYPHLYGFWAWPVLHTAAGSGQRLPWSNCPGECCRWPRACPPTLESPSWTRGQEYAPFRAVYYVENAHTHIHV